LAILGVVITQEDLNSNFLRSLPPEWNTHVVVWMNKADIETMSIDDLYNKFKIIEQDVKKSVGASTGAQNIDFMTAPSTSSTNDVNTANPAYEVNTVSPNVNVATPQVSTANFSDNVVYAFMVENPSGFNLLQQSFVHYGYYCSEGILGDRIIYVLDKTPDLSQRSSQNCPKCGNPVDGQYCQGCALLRKKFKEDLFTY
nr:hypothetical protein [Tanacetum cinerariifolium]